MAVTKEAKVSKTNELNSVQTLISSRNRNLAKSFNLENHFVQTLQKSIPYNKILNILKFLKHVKITRGRKILKRWLVNSLKKPFEIFSFLEKESLFPQE